MDQIVDAVFVNACQPVKNNIKIDNNLFTFVMYIYLSISVQFDCH